MNAGFSPCFHLSEFPPCLAHSELTRKVKATPQRRFIPHTRNGHSSQTFWAFIPTRTRHSFPASQRCMLLESWDFHLLPTTGFSIKKPLKVIHFSRGEQKAAEECPAHFPSSSRSRSPSSALSHPFFGGFGFPRMRFFLQTTAWRGV